MGKRREGREGREGRKGVNLHDTHILMCAHTHIYIICNIPLHSTPYLSSIQYTQSSSISIGST